jgi:hypothetical protein
MNIHTKISSGLTAWALGTQCSLAHATATQDWQGQTKQCRVDLKLENIAGKQQIHTESRGPQCDYFCTEGAVIPDLGYRHRVAAVRELLITP